MFVEPLVDPAPLPHPEFAHPSELTHLDLSAIEDAAERGAVHRAVTVALGVAAIAIAVFAAALALVALATNPSESLGGSAASAPPAPAQGPGPSAAGGTDGAAAATTPAAAPTLADAKGISFEKFAPVDATLPAATKSFDIDVYHHVTQVDKALAPTEVWSYEVNGKAYRGTGLSAPMVVTEGDVVDLKITNGGDKAMQVDMPHSLDFHAAEVNPGSRYTDLKPGASMAYTFTAKHPGVFMYHCATQPVLMHTGMGMVGMMVVKPKGLAPVDKELFVTQQEFYLGKPGALGDMAKMTAKTPDVIAFNGYANQYKDNPIVVRKGEKVRMYVLNAGPSVWSAFHVIGTVFDRTVVEGVVGRDAQTVDLAPSQGGWVEFTLDAEGSYPFVTHAFGDMVKGALGVIRTEHAPKAAAGSSH